MSPFTPPRPETIPPRRHVGNPLGAAGVCRVGGGRGNSWVPPTRDSLFRARRRRRRRPSPASSCRGHAGRKRWGPPIPQPPNLTAVFGGGSARGAALSPRSAASGSASPRTDDLCTGRGGGGGDTVVSAKPGVPGADARLSRAALPPAAVGIRGRTAGDPHGAAGRGLGGWGNGGGNLLDVKVRGKDGAPGAASAHSLPGGA